jgi:hypothetical protein
MQQTAVSCQPYLKPSQFHGPDYGAIIERIKRQVACG